jgi:Helicase conserved C-terminal domain
VLTTAQRTCRDYQQAKAQGGCLPWNCSSRYVRLPPYDFADHFPVHLEAFKTITFPVSLSTLICSLMTELILGLAQTGVGIHHAGLMLEDRQLTENLFLHGTLKCLFATSTLAVGVNLPAHTVIIKGVETWDNGEWREYSDLDIMQMMGRAVR